MGDVQELVLSFDVGIKNMAVCLMIMSGPNRRILRWGIIDITSEKKNDLNSMSINLINELDQFVLDNLDSKEKWSLKVLIENQPVMKAPTMKSIQMIIYTYFQILGIHEGQDLKIFLVSAMKKNTYMKSKGYEIKAKDYKSNKLNSIKFVEDYLTEQDDQSHLSYLQSLKKKDDVCDALIQIFAFLNI